MIAKHISQINKSQKDQNYIIFLVFLLYYISYSSIHLKYKKYGFFQYQDIYNYITSLYLKCFLNHIIRKSRVYFKESDSDFLLYII